VTSIHSDSEFEDTFGSEAEDRPASGQSNDRNNDRDAEENIDENDRHLIAIDEALATHSPMPSFPDSIDTECNPDWARQMSLIQLLRKTLPETGSTSESNVGFKSLQLQRGSAKLPEHALGHFQLIRLLGYGGCGMVYLAKDPRNDRCIALKVPRPDILLQPGMQLRFINEARAAASLSHSNIASVYEVGNIDGMAYFTAQYCEGGSLAEWLATRDRPPTTKVSASIIAHLADAIEFAHCRGVLHRDIKPNNILLTRRLESDADPIEGFEWTPKLIDFGLAKVSGEDLTRTGDMIGTLRYMAPEMIGNRGDSRSDVYGLGMTLYEILLGSPAHDAVDQAQLLHQVTQGTPIRPSRVRPDVTRDLETIVLKSIDPDPERRYQHAGALGDDLRRFLNNYPIQARAVGSFERGYLWCRRNRVLATLISIACIACCTTVMVSVTMAVLQYRANNNLRVAQQRTAEMATELAWDQGRRLCKEGQIGIGLLWLGRALETAPKSSDGYEVALRTEIASWLDRCVALRWSFHHPNAVNAVAYSADGKLLLAGGADGVATIWNIETGAMHRKWNAHVSAIHSVSFCDDDSQALTSCLDGDVKRWQLNETSAEVLSTLSHPAEVRVVQYSEGLKGFVTGCEDGQVRFWNQEGQADGTSIQADGAVVAIDFNASGQTIAVAYFNKEISQWEVGFWDLENRSRLPQRLHCRRRFRSVRYSPDGKFLLTGDDDWEANLWHADSGELYATLLQDGNASSVDFSADSADLIIACEDTASVNTFEIKQIEKLRKQNGVFVHRFGQSSLLHR
jgi:eukaryotic-like serine/threonine-protein kinase